MRPRWNSVDGNRFVLLEGGVLGRADDMMIIRGVNIFPGSVEQIVRQFPEIVEYRLIAHKRGEMDALTIEVEDPLDAPQRVAESLHLRLGLRVTVKTVPRGALRARKENHGGLSTGGRRVKERRKNNVTFYPRLFGERAG